MALSLAMRAPLSDGAPGIAAAGFDRRLNVLWATFLTLLVTAPWLPSGYLFGTDWPGPRQIALPTTVFYSAAPIQAGLAAISWAFGGESAGKVLIVGSLFVAAATAYASIPLGGFIPRAAASAIFLLNPFVYGRLHYGQIYLLAAYALLPWVAIRFRSLLLEPGIRSALLAALGITLLGILDLHMFVIAAVLATAVFATHILSPSNTVIRFRRLAPFALLAGAATIAASAYWIVPLLVGRGPEASRLAGIGSPDLAAFAAIPDQRFGLVPNLLGLYGFWAESVGRFTPMKVFVPIWPAILALLLVLCGIGVFTALRRRQDNLAPWVAGLLFAAVVALILEMGVSHPWTAGLVRWLDATIPPYRGMRDAGKWAALLALAYSQLGGLGAAAVLDWVNKRRPGGVRSEWVASITAGVLLALPVYYGNGLLYGSHGEIKPSQYPAGWYAADRELAADPRPGRTLFLPWHEYMAFGFIKNQNRVVAPPGPSFFSVPLVVSLDPELPGIGPAPTPDQIAFYDLTREGAQGHWAEVLTSRHVKYVLLAREVDWQSYKYLETQPNLVLVRDFGSIALYRNLLIP